MTSKIRALGKIMSDGIERVMEEMRGSSNKGEEGVIRMLEVNRANGKRYERDGGCGNMTLMMKDGWARTSGGNMLVMIVPVRNL